MKNTPRFPTFYVDDSSCEIAGRKHVILAGVSYEDEDSVIGEWLALKTRNGLSPTEEVKWNNRKLPIELRREFIPLAASGTGVAVIGDDGKQSAALQLTTQVSRCCEELGYSGYRLRFDQDIVSNWTALDVHCLGLKTPCIGMCDVDSKREQLVQCADFLAGAIKLGISFGTGLRDPNEMIKLRIDAGSRQDSEELEEYELGWFLFGSLRYCIWGETVETSTDPEHYAPVKTTYGKGIAVRSSLPDETIADAIGSLDGFYMGCIH